ncbi:MAG: Crp/Fnr family transcriptional regulator [Pseudomonadota bacterium]
MNRPQAALSREETLSLIRGWKWFEHVPAAAHEWLADSAKLRSFRKGHHLYRSGDAATQVYGVVSGVFRIYMNTSKGDEVTGEEVVRGSWFPHTIPSDKPQYYANCVCQQDAVVVEVSQQAIADFAARWPGYFRGLYAELAARGPATLDRILLLSLHNLNVRLAVYLLRMASLRGEKDAAGQVFIAGEISQTEIGARVGGTRQRINALLKTWVARGLIELHPGGIRIRDVARLGAEAKKSGFDLESYLQGWHGGWQGKKQV